MENLNDKCEQVNHTLARLCKTIRINKFKSSSKLVTSVINKIKDGSEDNVDNLILFEFGKFHVSEIHKVESLKLKKHIKLRDAIRKIDKLEREVKQIKKEYKTLNSLIKEE